MSDALNRFVALSSALTGYNAAELGGTGLSETHFDTLLAGVGEAPFGQLLSEWDRVVERAAGDAKKLTKLVDKKVLSDPDLGPIARNVISLWYLGEWQQMPSDWRQRFGATAMDQTRVVSPEAYREGLVWSAIGAHPMGAKQQGYGAWSLKPPEPWRPSEEDEG